MRLEAIFFSNIVNITFVVNILSGRIQEVTVQVQLQHLHTATVLSNKVQNRLVVHTDLCRIHYNFAGHYHLGARPFGKTARFGQF